MKKSSITPAARPVSGVDMLDHDESEDVDILSSSGDDDDRMDFSASALLNHEEIDQFETTTADHGAAGGKSARQDIDDGE